LKFAKSVLSRSVGVHVSSSASGTTVVEGAVGRGLGTGVGSEGSGRLLVVLVADGDGAAEAVADGGTEALADGAEDAVADGVGVTALSAASAR